MRIVAASGPVDEQKFRAGVKVLDGRYRVSFDPNTLFARTGFLAGDDNLRLHGLNEAIRDPECRAVVLARGGYGLTRILPEIDRMALRKHPKSVVGYSDGTALLAVCAHAGVAAIHGPMVSDLAELSQHDRASLFGLLENPDPGELLSGLEALVTGSARGRLIGGNLEVLSRLLGTPFQPDFEGAVIVLEEVGEAPYRVDRLLTHLEQAGVFGSVAGVVAGDFTDCDITDGAGSHSPTIRDVLVERLGRLRLPVALGGGFGHGDRKASLPHGVWVELDSGAGTLTAVEGAVS